ncbi:hypothetical protein [Thermosynechococcus sp. NK55a]|nr:hypothetical protein [Thermosynechococcus sp. NK55a]
MISLHSLHVSEEKQAVVHLTSGVGFLSSFHLSYFCQVEKEDTPNRIL